MLVRYLPLGDLYARTGTEHCGSAIFPRRLVPSSSWNRHSARCGTLSVAAVNELMVSNPDPSLSKGQWFARRSLDSAIEKCILGRSQPRLFCVFPPICRSSAPDPGQFATLFGGAAGSCADHRRGACKVASGCCKGEELPLCQRLQPTRRCPSGGSSYSPQAACFMEMLVT